MQLVSLSACSTSDHGKLYASQQVTPQLVNTICQSCELGDELGNRQVIFANGVLAITFANDSKN